MLPIDYHIEHEVMVQGVYAPTEAREGQTIGLRVVLRATGPTAGTLYLKRDGTPIDLNGPAPGVGAAIGPAQWSVDSDADASLGKFVCVRLVEVPMAYSGPNRFEAVFEPASPGSDTMAANNQADAFTLVHGKGRVLFVDGVGGAPGEVLPNTLTEHGILLDVVGDHELPATLADYQRYDAVILQNVPADRTTPSQQRILARYVNDLGGGLIMIGGPDSFGAGGWTNSPVDHILPVECQIPSQTILPSGALVIVIDRSGSMAEGLSGSTHSKEEIANEAAVQAIATLYPQDMVGVVVFDTDAQWVVPLRLNSDPADTASTVRKITPRGGTDIYPALVMAYNGLATLQAQDAAIKHIILLTDGDSVEGKYYEIVQKMVQADITLSTVGVGDDVNVQLLNQLAQMGGGTFYRVQDPNRLPQIFIKEARSIRKNLIKEIAFKPQVISTGSPIMAGVSSVPELKGLVLTGMKNDPRVMTPIVGPEGEPVFAHWQVGLGRTAAFTSDATNRWATGWLTWGGYADFWSRTVRDIARPSDSRQFDMLSSIRGDTLHLRLDAVGAESELASKNKSTAQGSFSNFLRVGGSVIKPDGSLETVNLHQTGPGVYETDTPAQGEGNYIVSLFVQDPSGERHAVFGGASRPPGSELRQFSSNRAILERVAQITGGRVLDPVHPDPSAIFNREAVVPSRSIRPLWWPLLAWLLVLFLLDVACRRIAWDIGAIWRWATSWITAAGRQHGQEAEATLAALKARAAQVNRKLGELTRAAPPVDVRGGSHPTASSRPPPMLRLTTISPSRSAARGFRKNPASWPPPPTPPSTRNKAQPPQDCSTSSAEPGNKCPTTKPFSGCPGAPGRSFHQQGVLTWQATTTDTQVLDQAARFKQAFAAVREQIGRVIVGQNEIVDGVLTCLFVGGHALLEGVPGLGKTLLIRSLSQALTLKFSRIQFTPDLMPADITGTTIVIESQGADGRAGGREFRFQPGPIFAQIVLADEINRATPKTQSAMLEAMQERSVTVGWHDAQDGRAVLRHGHAESH